MIILKILGAIIVIYLLGFLVTPNHVFFVKIRRTKALAKIAKKFKSKTKEETLRKTYSYVTDHFSSEKYNFVLQFYKLFNTNVEKLLKKKQFAQCTPQNHTLVTLLINTGQFKESDFKRRWTTTYLVDPHQYLLVKYLKPR